jgi:hypothetical protein
MLYSIPNPTEITEVPHLSAYQRLRAELDRIIGEFMSGSIRDSVSARWTPRAGFPELIGGAPSYSRFTTPAARTRMPPHYSSASWCGRRSWTERTTGRSAGMKRKAFP